MWKMQMFINFCLQKNKRVVRLVKMREIIFSAPGRLTATNRAHESKQLETTTLFNGISNFVGYIYL